jgi:hypothetical protein
MREGLLDDVGSPSGGGGNTSAPIAAEPAHARLSAEPLVNQRSLQTGGSSPTIIINVDASNSDVGVEQNIVNALVSLEDRILSQAEAMISRYDSRGY